MRAESSPELAWPGQQCPNWPLPPPSFPAMPLTLFSRVLTPAASQVQTSSYSGQLPGLSPELKCSLLQILVSSLPWKTLPIPPPRHQMPISQSSLTASPGPHQAWAPGPGSHLLAPLLTHFPSPAFPFTHPPTYPSTIIHPPTRPPIHPNLYSYPPNHPVSEEQAQFLQA